MKISTALFLATSTVACSTAFAGTQDIKNANSQFSVQAISTNVDYNETGDSGSLLDSENGHVPGYSVTASMMKDVLFGNDYLQFQYSHTRGNTDYTGSALFGGGSYGSLLSTSSATITDYSLRWGKGYVMSQEVMLTPYLELGHHEWKRGVNEGETYSHSYMGVGGMAQFSPLQRLVLSANALVGQTYNANINVAGRDGFSGPLGSAGLFKVGASLDYAFTRYFHGNIGVDYTSFKYGRSGNYLTPDGYFYEPKSDSKYTTVSAGVGYSF